MSVWFVSRHPGAIAWARHQDLSVNHWVTHLDVTQVAPGDHVIGTLPMTAAADVCSRGARFFSLELHLAENQRGRELTEEELRHLNCTTQEFVVLRQPREALHA